VLSWSPAYSTKKTQNAIRPRRRLPVSQPISKKFATANCPYQTQPRTSVQLTVRTVLQLELRRCRLGIISPDVDHRLLCCLIGCWTLPLVPTRLFGSCSIVLIDVIYNFFSLLFVHVYYIFMTD